MPRKAREKHPEAVFHIMCRSISEILLFRDDDDKDYYLGLLKRYKEQYRCSIYGYCVMDNHVHIHLDPGGMDVSTFMHSTNTAYVRYYNKKYQRHGHLFQGRFQSKVLDTDAYNLAVSAYIHNNAQDIGGFSGREEHYKYSSYGIYLGMHKDQHQLIDKSFLMGLFNVKDVGQFVKKYFVFVSHQRDIGSFKKLKEKLISAVEYEYISGRKVILRDLTPSKVVSYISSKLLKEEKENKSTKPKIKPLEFRAFTAYVLRVLCGLRYKEICSNLYNITISGCSRLCNRGYELVNQQGLVYSNLFNELSCFRI